MVVHDPQQPHRHDPEHPDEREIRAPELARHADVDAAPPPSPLLLELHHEIATPDQDLPKRLARGREAEDPLGDPPELPGAEGRMLDMEADDLHLDLVWRPVVGSESPPREARWLLQAARVKPSLVEPPHPPLPALEAPRHPPPVLVDGDGQPE
ncbi:MAG: hypothetical protein KC766_28810 [Myxococcales bacterium]|nr:hypothetical protein [Myxococcales bacterium]